ncbi:MAG: chemotaxis protein CheX [Syntrophaceae bacterium]|nr:chemotaxis protein CheX [Syntrophaceae bacterium]
MKENIRQTLTKATFEVFEKMFFVFLEPIDAGPGPYDCISAIDFGGQAKGTLSLMMSRGLTEMMVQNMLGCEPEEVTEQMVEDCSKEAANMVCGNFLRKMSEQDVFNLSLPKYVPASQVGFLELPSQTAEDVSVSFESDGEPLQLWLSWKEAG